MRKLRLDLPAPFLLTLYPLLFYYSYNFFKIDTMDVIGAIAIGLFGVAVVLAVTTLIFRSLQRGLFLTSIFAILFFTYGHLLQLFARNPIVPFDRPRHLTIFWILLLLAAVVFAIRKPASLKGFNRAAGMVSGILILVSLSTITVNAFSFSQPDLSNVVSPFEIHAPDVLPDIYYIILDEYGGGSTLRDYLGFDNSEFLNSLSDRGFYVVEKAHSNYYKTYLSLPSSLNMTYLDFFNGHPNDDPSPAIELVRNNIVAQTMKRLGYTYIHFGAANVLTRYNKYADVIYDGYSQARFMNLFDLFPVTDFTRGLTDTTWLSAFVKINDQRERVLYNLKNLPDIPKMPAPTFTFVHMMIPHEPWVFQPEDGPANPNGRSVDGRIVDPDKYALAPAYIDQVMYTNRVISQLVDTLLEESETDPIIIIQGDHGFRRLCNDCETERASWDDQFYADIVLPIFSVYYLPNGGSEMLYPTISPVNSFRLIFDYYFGANLELLEDRHFRPVDYETRGHDFVDITNVVRASQNIN